MKIDIKQIWLFLVNLFSAFGILWLAIEITNHFATKEVNDFVKGLWWLFGILGLAYAIFMSLPKNKITLILKNTGTILKILQKDIFKIDGALIVPINNHFKVNQDGNLLESKSILSQVVKKYYNSRPEHLQSDLDNKLKDENYKHYKENDLFKIGTVVPIKSGNKKFYFLANTILNRNNKSECTDEMFEKSLNELWIYLADYANKDDFIIPLIGTGNGRLKTDPNIVFEEILLSFISSLSYKSYASSLTICIFPGMVKQGLISFPDVLQFSESKVLSTRFRKNNTSKGSNAISKQDMNSGSLTLRQKMSFDIMNGISETQFLIKYDKYYAKEILKEEFYKIIELMKEK